MTKSTEVYGIKNCTTVRKSIKWLQENDIEVNFHDFKKEILSTELVNEWFEKIETVELINKRGTTWRNLTDLQKNLAKHEDLVKLIIENPSIVKRPVVLFNDNWSVAFNEQTWEQKFL